MVEQANRTDSASGGASSSRSRSHPGPTAELPVHTTSVYLRIQPVLHPPPYPSPSTPSPPPSPSPSHDEQQHPDPDPHPPHQQLSFLLHLHDPSHGLTHTSQTQPIPARWLAQALVPWHANPWVEDRLVDALRVGLEVVGEGYVMERMGVVGLAEQRGGGTSSSSGGGTAQPSRRESPPPSAAAAAVEQAK